MKPLEETLRAEYVIVDQIQYNRFPQQILNIVNKMSKKEDKDMDKLVVQALMIHGINNVYHVIQHCNKLRKPDI